MYNFKYTKTVFFNFCLLFIFSLSLSNQVNAQVLNGYFEDVDISIACPENGSWDCRFVDFICGTPGWNPFNGSPNTYNSCLSATNSNSQINPFEGDRFAGMTYTGSGDPRNEAIFTNVNVTQRSVLKFSHRLFTQGNGLPGRIDVQIGMPNTLPVVNSIEADPITTIFSGSDLLEQINGFNSTNWVSERILIPGPITSTLAFNPLPAVFIGGIYAVDDVKIEPCSEQLPAYQFTDALGNPKMEFCIDEDVYIKVSEVDYTYPKIFIDIWGDNYYNLGWLDLSDNNCYNISQLLASQGEGPIVLGDYSLKVAVNHPECGWIEGFEEFSIVCCEGVQDDNIDANFSCSFDNQLPIGIEFTGTATTDVSASGGTHEFCIYTDNDNDGFFDLVSCSSTPQMIEMLQPGIRYYFTHTVTTECGTNCETKDWCYNNSNCPAVTPVESCDDIITCDELAPDFIFTDAQGNPKTEFCLDEEIYIKLDVVDYSYSNVYFEVQGVGGLGWNAKTANDCYNISQLLIDRNLWPLNPGVSYNLKVALNHLECGWAERIKPFSVICCDSNLDIDANFDTSSMVSGTEVKYNATAVIDYTSTGATHEFCIYTDEDGDGVFQVITCIDDVSISVTLDRDTRYYVTHTITTPCGVFCELQTFCVGDCIDAAPLDSCDDIIVSDCQAPVANCPEVVHDGGGTILSWSDVGADSYVYEIRRNDPDCGCEGPESLSAKPVEGNETLTNIQEGSCYSYRVRAICDGELESSWSAKICSDCGIDVPNDDDEKEYDGGGEKSKTTGLRSLDSNSGNATNISAYPSPFDSYLNINVVDLQNEIVELRVLDLMGKVLKSETIKVEDQSLNYKWDASSTMTSGIYLIQVVDGKNIYSKKVIKL